MIDLWLAVAHHVLAFGLVAMLMIQRALLKAPGLDLTRLARLDAGFGATAGLLLAVGAARVVWGGKGWAFYEANPFFWAKILVFGLIAAISIVPTLRFIAWTRATRTTPGFQPPESERARVRMLTGIEALLLLPLLAAAAAMARWPF